MKKKIFILIVILAVFLPVWVYVPENTYAAEESTTLTAIIDSKVCAQYSSVTSNVSELLADLSQKAILTVYLEDCTQVPMANIDVKLTSNRGAIDKIDNVDADGDVITAGDGLGVMGTTDANGYAFFAVYSQAAGQAIISSKADTLVDLNQIKPTFLPLPFPKNVVVSIEVPSIFVREGKVTIFRPKELALDKERMLNLGIEIIVPFWVLLFILFWTVLDPVLFVAVLGLIRKIKKIQEKEEKYLEKEGEEIEKVEEMLKDDLSKNDSLKEGQ